MPDEPLGQVVVDVDPQGFLLGQRETVDGAEGDDSVGNKVYGAVVGPVLGQDVGAAGVEHVGKVVVFVGKGDGW